MTISRKTDNHSLAAKLDLRRHFLARHHVEPPRVLDCCQGSGKIWAQLGAEFPLAPYWGLDKKKKVGRLSVDSARILSMPGWDFDVIDVDTYGSPWTHWLAILRNVRKPVTVFLTIGFVRIGGGGIAAAEELDTAGIRFCYLRPAPALLAAPTIKAHLQSCLLALPARFGLATVEAAEAPPGRSARYVGMHLRPS